MKSTSPEGDNSHIEMPRNFRIVFQSVTCDECGSIGPVSAACECGAWQPHEDEYVQRRRRALAGLQDLIASPVEGTQPIGLEQAVDDLSPWIANNFDAMDALSNADGDFDGIWKSSTALVDLRRRVAAVPRRRPFLALWDPLQAALEHLASMVSAQLDGATAADPDSALATEQRAQNALDAAAAAIAVLNQRLDRWGSKASIRLPDSLVRAASAAYDMTGAENVLDLDVRGRLLYARITERTDAPSGIGIGLLLDLGLAGTAFDEERLFRVAKVVYRRLSEARDRLTSLLADPEWRADVLKARRVFYEAQLATETLLSTLEGDRRIEVEAILRLGGRLAEGVSRTGVGLIVAAASKGKWKRGADYTSVHQTARHLGLDDLLLGFDDRIRNASAHEDFEIHEDHVVLGGRRAPVVSMQDDELVDIVLSGLESAAAIFAGIDCLLAELEHPSATDRFGDLPLEDRMQILLAVSGVEPTKVKVTNARVELAGRATTATSVRPLTVIAVIEPFLPSELQQVRLNLTRRDGGLTVEAPLEPLRRFRQQEGFPKDVAFLEFLGRATINGRVIFSRRHVRFMAGMLAHKQLDERLEVAEPLLRELASVARRLKDHELVESIEAFTVAKAAREGGPPGTLADRAGVERLATYLANPPGPWNDGSPPISGSSGGAVAA